MIKESFDKDEENHHFNPKRLPVILTLAVATSIDALAVGISFACTGMDTLQDILWPIVIIGIVSFLFSMLGCFIGVFFGKRINLRAELWAGIILIGIGVKILMEHMEWI
jgi:putative Mn2+ efflux pump MntP